MSDMEFGRRRGYASEDEEYRMLFSKVREIQADIDDILETLLQMNDYLKNVKGEKEKSNDRRI